VRLSFSTRHPGAFEHSETIAFRHTVEYYREALDSILRPFLSRHSEESGSSSAFVWEHHYALCRIYFDHDFLWRIASYFSETQAAEVGSGAPALIICQEQDGNEEDAQSAGRPHVMVQQLTLEDSKPDGEKHDHSDPWRGAWPWMRMQMDGAAAGTQACCQPRRPTQLAFPILSAMFSEPTLSRNECTVSSFPAPWPDCMQPRGRERILKSSWHGASSFSRVELIGETSVASAGTHHCATRSQMLKRAITVHFD
jgi:hypothetical protein